MDDIHRHDTNGYLLTIKAQLDAGQEYYNIRCEFQQLQWINCDCANLQLIS